MNHLLQRNRCDSTCYSLLPSSGRWISRRYPPSDSSPVPSSTDVLQPASLYAFRITFALTALSPQLIILISSNPISQLQLYRLNHPPDSPCTSYSPPRCLQQREESGSASPLLLERNEMVLWCLYFSAWYGGEMDEFGELFMSVNCMWVLRIRGLCWWMGG